MAAYLGLPPTAYTPGQMTYDLRRLRLQGMLARLPHTQRYQVTTAGQRVALFFTRLNARVFRPGFAAFDPVEPIPRSLADAFANVNQQIDLLLHQAKLHAAA